ncbi:glycine--tRNA ligase subunit beta [Alkalihalobacillus sp. 1P02AB]|uniref:glycine--tRNA ligase subunit beta n=1 Tax=Alkalihalobacillus sp. 1P02AB TaxID=3132260 RepID=UPI0039A45528
MSAHDFLLEIGLEELPARFITDAMNQLEQKMSSWLNEQKLEYQSIEAFSTPRRLAVLVTGLADKQPDITSEAKGPAKKIALDNEGNWSKAAQGFARGQGVSVEDLFFKELKGVEYVYANTFTAGKETVELLEAAKELILSIHFPKNMRWNSYQLRYARPIQWLIALYGEKVIPFSIEGISTGTISKGHRFLGKEVSIAAPAHYVATLSEQNVVVEPQKRKEMIISQIQVLSREQNWVIPIDEDLLEEVNNLVEYPTALFGKFDDEFLEIPKDVLITSMREHQRYFPVENSEGELLPYFVTVRNGNAEHLNNVARGNEKVLRARLSDAAFFYEEDQKLKIDDAVAKLENIVYHEELGSIADKVRRVQYLTNELSDQLVLSTEQKKKANRVAEIAKFDLVTQMVYEFTELQGKMGQVYAELAGEDKEVAEAINEHYMPRFAGDNSPSSLVGVVVSVAEKIDTITTCFAIGLIPSGSQDPYALRRQATGIVQMLLDNDLSLSLETLIDVSLNLNEERQLLKRDKSDIKSDLLSFFRLRVKHMLQEKSIRYDVIDAVIANGFTEVSTTVAKANVLMQQVEQPQFKQVIEALSRVTNISKKQTGDVRINTSLFQKEEEENLYQTYMRVQEQVAEATEGKDYESAFHALAHTTEVIDQYFDHIMVMDENEEIKQNRLSQMKAFANVIYSFADFQAIVFS